MDDILNTIRDNLDGPIDFDGQRLAEYLSTGLLSLFGLIAFLIGYVYKDIFLTLWVGLAGTLFTMIAVVPPWPMYNKNPQPFLSSRR